MSPELIFSAVLNEPTLTALVGTRRAFCQLPQNSTFPALVYNIISDVPRPNVAYQNGPRLNQARIQLNILATQLSEIRAIREAVWCLLDFKLYVTIDSRLIVSLRIDSAGSVERDEESGLFTQSVDFELWYYENF